MGGRGGRIAIGNIWHRYRSSDLFRNLRILNDLFFFSFFFVFSPPSFPASREVAYLGQIGVQKKKKNRNSFAFFTSTIASTLLLFLFFVSPLPPFSVASISHENVFYCFRQKMFHSILKVNTTRFAIHVSGDRENLSFYLL